MTDTPTHDSLNRNKYDVRSSGDEYVGGAMNAQAERKPMPGVPESLDHLEFAQSGAQEAVGGLVDRLGGVLMPTEPHATADPGGNVDARPLSDVARIIHDHADRLESFASYVRSITARVDL